MITKELIDARWKAFAGAALALFTLIIGAFSYDMIRQALNPAQLQNIASTLGSDFANRFLDYRAFVWNLAFSLSGNSGIIIMIVTALLGASLIAGEVNKGTIFMLLSRPLSRDRILLTKYSVGVVILLALNILTGVVALVVSALSGRPQDVGGVAISVLLFWLGSLFVFGVATLLSVVFSDVLRPLGLTVVIIILLNLPGLFPNGSAWSLPAYWSSLPAFLGQEFPLKALIISLMAALVPVLLAVPLFRRQAY